MTPTSLTEPLTVNVINPCPLCDGEDTVVDRYNHEEICISCGCVVNDLTLNRGVNAMTYNANQGNVDSRRHGSGAYSSIFDKGLNTIISGNRDSAGSHLSQDTVQSMRRLQRQDNRSKLNESVMRNLSVAMAELDRLSYALNLSDNVKEGAATLYRKALTLDLVRGRSIDAFVAASLYAACRLLQVPRPLSLVCDESKRTRKEVSMTYRLLLTELNLKPPIDSPFKYVSVLAHDLEISRPTERKAVTLLEEARKQKSLIGKDPRGLAAAALYLACELNGERVVQRRVAKRAETTEVTLRNRYRGLKKALGIV